MTERPFGSSLLGEHTLAVTTGSFWPAMTEESIQTLQSIGIMDVELTLQGTEMDLTFKREFHMPILASLDRLVQTGTLRVGTVHAPRTTSEHSYSIWAREEYLIQTLRICTQLHAKIVVVHPFHIFRSYEEAQDFLAGRTEDVWQVLLPHMPAILNMAQAEGVLIALENIQEWIDDENGYFNRPETLLRFLQRAAHPNLAITLDTYHAHHAPAGVAGFLTALRPYIVNLHLADFASTACRIPPGQGCIPWDTLIPLMKELPHLHQATLELNRATGEGVVQALEFVTRKWTDLGGENPRPLGGKV